MKYFGLILVGLLFSLTLYGSYHYDNIFQIFIYLILGIASIIIIYKLINAEIESFENTRKISTFWSLIIVIITISLNLLIYSYYESKVNSPTLLKARIFGGYADFKTNGEYVIVSGPWASRKHFYGKYKIRDTIIVTDRKNFDDVITTDRFAVFKSDTIEEFDGIEISTFLLQVDDNGQELFRKYNQNNFRLRIIEDNRTIKNGR